MCLSSMGSLPAGRIVFLRPSSSLSSAAACASTSTLWRPMVAASSVRHYASKKKPNKKGPSLMEIERLEAKKRLKRFQRMMPKAEAEEAFEGWKAQRDEKKRLKEEGGAGSEPRRKAGKGAKGGKGNGPRGGNESGDAAAAAAAGTGIGTGTGTGVAKPGGAWWTGTVLSVQDRLKLARGPTLLYAKFSTGFLAATYGSSAGFLAISGWTYWANILHAPEGLAWWVQSVNSFATGAMAFVGLGMAYWPTR